LSASGLGRKFQFIREIASGGFGSVYLAKVIHGDGFARMAAIKLLHPKWSENEEIASRMRDEARLLGWLRHKNIVEVLDLTRICGRVAVIMEYLEAVDVKVVMADAQERGEPVPVRACFEIGACVASALDAAYNRPPYAGEKPLRVIHRDIKPSNVMVDTSGSVKVLDFGVARADFDAREAHTQELAFGSVEYMPPERLFFEPDTSRSDVYSLGATLYEMLALEKFGKARLRVEQHDAFVDERFADLLKRRTMISQEVEDEVLKLLGQMLSFDGADRPDAAECVSRMRALARRATDETVSEWAERVVPPLVLALQTRPVARSADSLVDRVVGEDSRGFVVDEETTDASEVKTVIVRAFQSTDEDELFDESGRVNDEQWKALKQATLAEITDGGLPPRPLPPVSPPEPAKAPRAEPVAPTVPAPGRPPLLSLPIDDRPADEPRPRSRGSGLLVERCR
jgi:serine/threonine-protein kinase